MSGAISLLGTDDLNIEEEEALKLLVESEYSNIKFPMDTASIFREQIRVKGFKQSGFC